MALARIRFTLLFLIPFVVVFTHSYPQIPTESPLLNDTTAYYSLDTLQRKPPPALRLIGSLDQSIPIYIRDSTINFVNYRSAIDLLSLHPGIFVRDFGGLGHIPDIRMDGNSSRQLQYTNDGFQMNDPWSGQYNIFFYPTENIERIEIVDGTRAFLYGFNSTGGVINFVSKSRRALRPYSRIRYSESGYGFSIIDGMLSQNVSRNLNVTAGIQHSVFGERYTNENFDGWNGRMKIRYDFGNTFSLFMAEIYNKTNLGLPGGIDRSATPDSLRFDNLQAIVINSDAYEKVTRHDFQAGIAAFPGTDSTAISTLTFYLSSNLREYRDEENRDPSNGIFLQQNQRAQWMGLKLMSNFSFGFQRITLGADVQSQTSLVTPSTREERAGLVSTFGKTEIPIIGSLIFSPYARFDSYLGEHPLSYGGDLYIAPYNGLEFFGGYSRSFRFPSFLERHGLDTIITSSLIDGKPERHHLLEAGIRWSISDWLVLHLRSFYRITWNPVAVDRMTSFAGNSAYTYGRHNKRTTEGMTGGISLQTGVLLLEGSVQYVNERDEQMRETTFPTWNLRGGIYYKDNLFHNHLDIKTGIQATAFSSYRGNEFNEQVIDFLPSDAFYNIGSNSIFDLVILAHIGDAYFHIILDNILNTHLVMNNFYPLHDRRLRFGISWEFLD